MPYFETEYALVDDNPEIGCSFMQWKRFTNSEEFREAMNQSLHLLQEKGYSKILSDARMLGPLDPVDQKWTVDEWLPKAVEAGYNRIALLVPTDVFSQIAVEDIMEGASESATTVQDRYFDTLESAADWLKQ